MRLEKIFSAGVTERKFPPIMLVIAAMHSQQSRKSRAVSSGVEHSIHTAGVASSKLAPPTRIQTKRPAIQLAFLRFAVSLSTGGEMPTGAAASGEIMEHRPARGCALRLRTAVVAIPGHGPRFHLRRRAV